MTEPIPEVTRGNSCGRRPAAATAFVCANCARPARKPTSAGRPRPDVPDFRWPVPVQEVLLPCTGRLQPEHVLKAFESGSDLVFAVGCAEGNCHYLEGSKRCARRVEHVRSLLQEIGLEGERLLFFTLPGTAAEDMALGVGRAATPAAEAGALVAAIRDRVVATIEALPPSGLRPSPAERTSQGSGRQR